MGDYSPRLLDDYQHAEDGARGVSMKMGNASRLLAVWQRLSTSIPLGWYDIAVETPHTPVSLPSALFSIFRSVANETIAL